MDRVWRIINFMVATCLLLVYIVALIFTDVTRTERVALGALGSLAYLAVVRPERDRPS